MYKYKAFLHLNVYLCAQPHRFVLSTGLNMHKILYFIILPLLVAVSLRAQVPEFLPPPQMALARTHVLFSVPPTFNTSRYVFEIQIVRNEGATPLIFQRTAEVAAWLETDAIQFGDRITWHCTAQDAKGANIRKYDAAAFAVQKASALSPDMPVPYNLTEGMHLSVSDPYLMLNAQGTVIWEAAVSEIIPGAPAPTFVKPHIQGMAAAQSEDGRYIHLYHHTPYGSTRLKLPAFQQSDRRFQVFKISQDLMGHYLLLADIVAQTAAGKSFPTGAQAAILLDAHGNLLKYWDTDQILTPQDAGCKGNMTDAFFLPEDNLLYVCFKDLGRIVAIHLPTGATHAYVQGMPAPDVMVKSPSESLYKVHPRPGTPVLKPAPLDSVQAQGPEKAMLQSRVPRFPNTAVMRQPEAMCILPDQRLAVYGQNTDGKKSDVYGIMIMPLPNAVNFRSRNMRFFPLSMELFSENPAMNFRHVETEKLNHAVLEYTPKHHLFLHVPKAANALEVDTTGRIIGSVNMQRTFSPDVKELIGTVQGLYPVFFAISHYVIHGSTELRIQNLGTTDDTYIISDREGKVLTSLALSSGKVVHTPMPNRGYSIASARNPKLFYYIKE